MADDHKPFAHGGAENDSGAPAAAPQDVHPDPSHSTPQPPDDPSSSGPDPAGQEPRTPADAERQDSEGALEQAEDGRGPALNADAGV
jgi:hypothetical protein